MSKIFLLNPKIQHQDKSKIQQIQMDEQTLLRSSELRKYAHNQNKIQEEDNLRHVQGRVVVKIDMDYKNTHTFSDGTIIRRERQFNDFNRRVTQPVNCFVISGEGIKKGAEILIHQNAIHDSNRIFDYKDSNDDIHYYSIHNDMCFAWYDEDKNEWLPIKPYEIALRIFKPYEGLVLGLPPTQIKDALFVTTGEFKNKVVKTIVASDFEVIAQNRNGKEFSLIRFRPEGDPINKREEEAICLLPDITDKVLSGEYLLGYSESDCKTIQEINPQERP